MVGAAVALTLAFAASASSSFPASRSADPKITWEGTIAITDRYTHEYTRSERDNQCTGTVVSTLKTTYAIAPAQSARIVQPDRPTLDARYRVDGESATFNGSATCRKPEQCNGFSVTGRIGGSGRFSVVYPGTYGQLIYHRVHKKLELPASGNGRTEITMPDSEWQSTYLCGGPTSGRDKNTWVGRVGGPRLQKDQTKDYRLDVQETPEGSDPARRLLSVKRSYSYYLTGGHAGIAANNFALGSYSNFDPLPRFASTRITLLETIRVNLRGRLTIPCDARVLYVDHEGSVPGVKLFDFDTRVSYKVCPDGAVKITRATGFGTVRYGKTTLALNFLGFDFDYAPAGRPVPIQVSRREAEVDIGGNFNVEVDFGDLISNVVSLGVGRLTAALERRLTEIIQNKVLKDREKLPLVLAEVTRVIEEITDGIDKIDELLPRRGVPKVIADALENIVEEPLQAALRKWKREVPNLLAKKSAKESVKVIVGELEDVLIPSLKTSFPVWTPSIRHRIFADNAWGGDEGGWNNPFLAVKRLRNEVVTR